MTVSSMTKPLDKLKRIRSWDELRTRGGQALSAYREKKRGAELPSDEELMSLIDTEQFGTTPVIAESLWQRFFKNGEKSFFPSMRRSTLAGDQFRRIFGAASVDRHIQTAEGILAGRIDLLGFKGLYVGTEIDWHREPLSAKRSPLKYWKEFDELETAETGNKKIIWELNRHQHFFSLGLAYVLTDDERFADAFAAQLESWMEQNPPSFGVNWSSSLEVAFRAMSWIWAFHLFRDSDAFTPALFKQALQYLYLHGRHIEQYLSKYYSPNTHLTGEALALYYLGTQLRVFGRAEKWRRLGEDILFDEITKQVLPDGVYFEQSTWYQRYTADIYSHFSVLRSLDSNAEYDRRTQEFEERFEKCFEHLMWMSMPDGTTPLIGDDDGGRILPLTPAASDDFRGTLAVGAMLFSRGDMKVIAGQASEETFWLFGDTAIGAYKSQLRNERAESCKGFPDGGYFVMRDGWDDTDSMLIVDCGPVGSLAGGHGHADALAIEVAVHGKTLLVDSGTYTYHESPETRDYFRSSEAHNTLSVDGLSSSEFGGAFGWQKRANSTVKKWIAEDRFAFFQGEHDGYQRLSDPVTHGRSILFVKNDCWIIRDAAEANESHEYALNFHYAEGTLPAIADGGASVGDDQHRIFTFGDNGAWEQKESWVSRNHGSKINAPLMRFVSTGSGTQEFFTFILPTGGQGVVVSEIPMQSGRAFSIKSDLYTDLFVFNDEPGKSISTGLFETSFTYSWARLREGEQSPDEFIVVGGDRLVIDDVTVLDAECGGYSSIRRVGEDLYVKTAAGRSKVSLRSE